MLRAVPHIVVLDDVLDAHELRLAGRNLLHQLAEIAVYLAAAALDLFIEIAVPWYGLDNEGIGDEIVPVRAGYWRRPVFETDLCTVEVLPPFI